MKLLLDMGNSSIAWAQSSAGVYASSGKFFYAEDSLAATLEQELSHLDKPDAVLLASVAGEADNRQLCAWLQKKWDQPVWQASVGERFQELVNSYTDCQQMGVDRWLAMIAAWDRYRCALCVVDCGTAITIDLIQASGKHAGGFILPGTLLMQQVLIDSTGRIQAHGSDEISLGSANNTQQAISHGASLAIVGAIERAVADFESQTEDQLQCVITGGSADRLRELLTIPLEYRPQLVLDGLARLYETSI